MQFRQFEHIYIFLGDCKSLKFTKFQEHLVNSHTRAVGTEKYRAKEVLTGHYSKKCDIYSLGVIGKELFNFENYQGETNSDIKELLNVLDIMTTDVYEERPTCQNVLLESENWNISLTSSKPLENFLTDLNSGELREYSLSTYIRHHLKLFELIAAMPNVRLVYKENE